EERPRTARPEPAGRVERQDPRDGEGDAERARTAPALAERDDGERRRHRRRRARHDAALGRAREPQAFEQEHVEREDARERLQRQHRDVPPRQAGQGRSTSRTRTPRIAAATAKRRPDSKNTGSRATATLPTTMELPTIAMAAVSSRQARSGSAIARGRAARRRPRASPGRRACRTRTPSPS